MKKNIALILLLVLSLHVLAQNKNHIIHVDWKAIEKTVKARPDSVKALVARFVQPQMDNNSYVARMHSCLLRSVVYK